MHDTWHGPHYRRHGPAAFAATIGTMSALPLLLTMGDACGIGPEIIVRAFADGAADGGLVIGDPEVLRRAARALGRPMPLARVESCADLAEVPPDCVPVLRPASLPSGLAQLAWGQVHARSGEAAARCVEAAAQLLLAGQAAAMVTAPLHKEALAAAGIGFPGHTEMLQALATPPGATPPPVRMMLANDELRVVLVSIHVALRRAVDLVSFESVLQTIRIAHEASAAWGLPRPRIAVAGLNPHAGEGGLFGDEEQRHIAPAVAAARRLGIDANGPIAPDTVFMRARHATAHPGEFDIVVAMTHDHGLIPVKYLGVEQGVNVTLGLPFVRTSPDHGTAFDIAGTGRADASSLKAAIRCARQLCAGR
jgi:4-hydroxythreonine-4-phosphate dehydrogenase